MGFKIGERVVVWDDSYSFSRNADFFENNKIDFKIATRYSYGTHPLNGDEGTVVAIGEIGLHNRYKGIVIQDDYDKCFLIGEPGLRSLEKEFKPHLECTETGVCYGTIGKEAGLVDRYGRKLKIGDVVILRIGKSFVFPEVTIVEDICGCCFPMGYAIFEDRDKFVKIRDCDEIPNGVKVGNIKYVKEER